MEDYFLGKATERVFLPLLRMIVPDILDYDLPIVVFSTIARTSKSARNIPSRPGGSCTPSGERGRCRSPSSSSWWTST